MSEFQIGDWVKTLYGEIGQVVEVSEGTVFYEDGEWQEDVRYHVPTERTGTPIIWWGASNLVKSRPPPPKPPPAPNPPGYTLYGPPPPRRNAPLPDNHPTDTSWRGMPEMSRSVSEIANMCLFFRFLATSFIVLGATCCIYTVFTDLTPGWRYPASIAVGIICVLMGLWFFYLVGQEEDCHAEV